MNPLSQNLLEAFARAADPVAAEGMSNYMRGKFAFFGIPAPRRKALQQEAWAAHKPFDREACLDAAALLWDEPRREAQYAALELLAAIGKKLRAEDLPLLEDFATTRSWWDTVDALATRLIGPLAARHPEVLPAHFPQWLESDDLWLNRVGILYQLKYKENTDLERLEQAILRNVHKTDFFIQKAIGWALRELAKTQELWVLAKLEQWGLRGLARREALKHVGPIDTSQGTALSQK